MNLKYEKHIFVCTNQKEAGKKCCGEAFGMEIVQKLREKIKANGLPSSIRAQKAGCLDVCALGPAMVVYPEGVFYGNLTLEKVDEIFEKHILGGKPVDEFQLDF